VTVTADWQVELGGVTIGAGTGYVITGPITGLGSPVPRSADSERGMSPGDVAGVDVDARRVLTIQVGVDETDAASAMTSFEVLKSAWASSSVDVALDIRLPGFASVVRRFYGRPRGMDVELASLHTGWIDVLATFEALDPYGYGPEQTVTLVDGDTVIAYPGSAPSDRYRIELTSVTEAYVTLDTAGPGPALTLVDVPYPATLDGRTRTIVDDTGVDLYSHLAPGSGWPVLTPGTNSFTLDGASGTLTYRPGYR
jgi:hypothetical protein